MPTTPDKPVLAIDDLERYAPPGVVAAMDAAALGAFVRLLSHAWSQDPPCSLPADDETLAVVARFHVRSDWDRVKPVLLLAFTPDTLAAHRLVNAVARGIYDQAQAKRRAVSEAQRARVNARWSRRDPPDPVPERTAGIPADTGGIPAVSAPILRSDSLSSAPAPLRPSQPMNESERPSERSDSGASDSIAGSLGAGARAHEQRLLEAWRETQSRRILELALDRWQRAGACRAPVSKAREISSDRRMVPAIVDTAVAAVDVRLERELRLADARGEDCTFNAFGYLLGVLGLSEKSRRDGRDPIEPSLQASALWSDKIAAVLPAIRAEAARLNAIDRRDPVRLAPKDDSDLIQSLSSRRCGRA